jgi:hypothetical protein
MILHRVRSGERVARRVIRPTLVVRDSTRAWVGAGRA